MRGKLFFTTQLLPVHTVFCPGFQKGRVPSENGTFSVVNGRQKGTICTVNGRKRAQLAR